MASWPVPMCLSSRGAKVGETVSSKTRASPCSITASRLVAPPVIWWRIEATAAARAEIATSMPTRSNRRRLAGRPTRVMTLPTPSWRPSSEASRLRSSLSITDTSTSLRPTFSDSRNSRSVPSPLSTSVRRSVAASSSPRWALRSTMRRSICGICSSRCASCRPTSPPPMIVTCSRPPPRAGCTRASTACIASGVPITITLSPAPSWVVPRGTKMRPSRFTATISAPRGRCRPLSGPLVSGEAASRRYSSRRMTPPAKASASMAPGTVTMRSMSAASWASGQTTRSMPKAARPPSAAPPATNSGRDTRQMVRGRPSRLARAQATMLTSSRPVAATNTSACRTPARVSTSSLVPLPSTNSTSIAWKASPTTGSWSMTNTSWLGARARARPAPTWPPPAITMCMEGARPDGTVARALGPCRHAGAAARTSRSIASMPSSPRSRLWAFT